MIHKKIRFLAFYLPQFHSIPENDKWWGKGFTEWTSVKRAMPLFKGHYQPHIPTELGYYNLLDSEVRQKQASMAQAYGIDGFCYWHYWFGNGKRLLEQPAKEVLSSGKPDFPFCFAWANHSWTRAWNGMDNTVLLKQEYLGYQDDVKHFYEVLSYFKDQRYIRHNKKPVFILYRPFDHPYLETFIETWQNLALKEGLAGIYFLGISYTRHHTFRNLDGLILHDNGMSKAELNLFDKAIKKLTKLYPYELLNQFQYNCQVFSFTKMIETTWNIPLTDNQYPTILAGWDNTPRRGKNGKVYLEFTPELFAQHVRKVIHLIKDRNDSFCFIKSWNEWAEGNYLEPDERFGYGKLKAFTKVVSELE